MSSLLLFAVLLTVFLQPVAAANPVMDLTPPGSPLPYHMNELIVCTTCGSIQFLCLCLSPLPYNHTAAFAQPDDPIGMPLPETFDFNVNMEPVMDYVTGNHRPALNNEYIQYIDANETTVQPITVQAHIEDTYTPGDRSSSYSPRSRKRSHKRQAPRERGFACNKPGCSDVFNRQCDLNRHHKTSHLNVNERPHVCPTCDKGFLYPKDLRRHMRQHSDPSSVMVTFRCEHPDCSNLDGFSRKDNLQRHQRRQHRSQ